MSAPSGRRRFVTGVTVAATAALAVVVPSAVPAAATPAASPGVVAARSDHAVAYDARSGANGAEKAQLLQHRLEVQSSKAVMTARSALGSQAVLDIDGLTGTPRQVARLDGFLTGPSSATPEAVARGYLAAHPDLFRLSRAEVAGLVLSRDYADISGVHHLSFTQRAGGLTLFGNGVKADVTKTGALVQVTGSPLPGLTAVALPAKAAVTSAAAAITVAKTDTAEKSTAPAKGDSAQQMLFRTPGSTRVAWRTVTMSAATPTLDVVDAATGRLLYRDPLADDYAAPTAPAAPAAPVVQYANVVDNYPGAAVGGDEHAVSLNQNGWLPRGSVVLFGNNSHTYADVNDNNQADQTEEIGATGNQGYRFPLQTFRIRTEPCSTAFPCTWNPSVPNSWQANLDRTATQNFYFINKYHDHLQAAPIGFTEAAGNFQQVNGTGQGQGGDPVVDQPLDGANTAGGLPDGNHIDNANFATPPDGTAPVMQMYLWHQPGVGYPADPFIASSGSDEADIVYHEYTHGLSHRLVVDADNVPALDSTQGGSMGEAWSDWYALDYLVNDGYFTDTSKAGEIEVGKYVIAGAGNFRSEPTDCPVGSTARACPGTPAAGPGGYTYGDFGKIAAGGPEVHADGEIWAQTLWDLRTALGSATTESLVTRAMELSPTLPSMLDMRNAILIADQTVFGGSHSDRLWKLFAKRGMGFFAGTVTGDDTAPVEDFSLPPTAASGTGTLTGTVSDSATGAPVKGARVAFGGHDSGLPGASYAAVTDAHGVFTIGGVVAGTYPDVYAVGGGYDLSVLPQVKVVKNVTRSRNFSLLRDWAASSGGGSISDFTGVDYSAFGCGPAGDIDQSGGVGWGSESDLDANSQPTAATPKYIVIALPAAVDVSGISINPSNTCGDGASAATGDYKVDVSTDGHTFSTAATGTFTTDDLGRLNPITLAGPTTGIVAVKFWMLSPQVVTRGLDCSTGAFSGCLFMDSSEVEVYGVAAG